MVGVTYRALALLILTGLVSSEQCDPKKCNVGIQKYYKELNCQPVQESGICCPAKYDCTGPLRNRAPGKCHLKGVAYEPGAVINRQQVGDNCISECRCSKFGVEATFQCPSSECPELLAEPLQEGCVRLYAHDTCCSTSTHCSHGNATRPAAKKAFTCQYGGKNYVLGQKFFPTEKPCLNCICQQGFDGTLNGAWCKDVTCNVELHYGEKIVAGCAPIYFGQRGCCPIGWRCPAGTQDTVVRTPGAKCHHSTLDQVPTHYPRPTVFSTQAGAECTFGNLRLKVSDKLNAHKPCVECKCTVPPHVSCSQRGYC